MRDRYTRYPRPILWLIPGSEEATEHPREGEPQAVGGEGYEVLVEPFYLSKFPVTNQQFEAFDGAFRRSDLSPGDTDPALGVSWRQAEGYCRWYARVSRKAMRLPTEQEWEHACRAGSRGRFFFGDDPGEADHYLWDATNSEGRLRPADLKRANPFGLFGMLGGVWEWTASPAETGDGEAAVLRGGSFRTPRERISCSLRWCVRSSEVIEDAGFRIARSFR